MSGLLSLPDELLVIVVGFLANPNPGPFLATSNYFTCHLRDLAHLAATNKRLCNITTPFLYGNACRPEYIHGTLMKRPRLADLVRDLSICDEPQLESLVASSRKIPYYERALQERRPRILKIWRDLFEATRPDETNFPFYFEVEQERDDLVFRTCAINLMQCRNLRRLGIRMMRHIGWDLPTPKSNNGEWLFPELEELAISGHLRFSRSTRSQVARIPTYAKNLRVLRFVSCRISQLPASFASSTIVDLSLLECNLRPDATDIVFDQFPNLRRLWLNMGNTRSAHTPSDFVRNIYRARKLTSFRMGFFNSPPRKEDQASENDGLITSLGAFPALLEIALDNTGHILSAKPTVTSCAHFFPPTIQKITILWFALNPWDLMPLVEAKEHLPNWTELEIMTAPHLVQFPIDRFEEKGVSVTVNNGNNGQWYFKYPMMTQ